jgi:hypothetical protein
MAKRIAIYGSFRARVPVRQRYWKRRRDSVKQRYWITTKKTKVVVSDGRYEFSGNSKELYKAVVLAHRYMPKGFVTVSARKFVENPEEYGFEGRWIEREIDS